MQSLDFGRLGKGYFTLPYKGLEARLVVGRRSKLLVDSVEGGNRVSRTFQVARKQTGAVVDGFAKSAPGKLKAE